MLGYTSKHLLALLAAIVCVMTITSLLLMHFIPAPPSQFSIAPLRLSHAQRRHRVDPGGAPCRQVTRRQGNGEE